MDAPNFALTDSHVHLDAEEFDADRAAVIARAREAGVGTQVVPAVDAASWPRIEALCRAEAGLHPAYGLHPMYLARHRPEHLDELPRQLREGGAVAVGEIGLDFYVAELDPEIQRGYFHRQLALAKESGLPVILHARRAVEETIHALRRYGGLRGVVHSYAGSAEQAAQLWKLGFCVGIGGPVTYPRAHRLRETVARLPAEQLLLETDSPDQPGALHRGQRNEPAHLREVLACVAALRGESEQRVAERTTGNARRLFGF